MSRRPRKIEFRLPQIDELVNRDIDDLHLMISYLRSLRNKGGKKGKHFRSLLLLCEQAFKIKSNDKSPAHHVRTKIIIDDFDNVVKSRNNNQSYSSGKGPMLIEQGRGRSADLINNSSNKYKNTNKI